MVRRVNTSSSGVARGMEQDEGQGRFLGEDGSWIGAHLFEAG